MAGYVDDADLVRATLEGDKAAFGELARRYRGAAFGVAFHKLGNFEAARDVAQEALVKAYLDLATLREPARFGNWLCRITTAAALMELRRRRGVVSLDLPGVSLRSHEPDPAESLERVDKARQVREALASLPEPDRLAVILHYVDGYSHEEIGGMLGTSVSSVKSRVHRARRRLREEMLDMVEGSLKSEAPKVEFTADLVYAMVRRFEDQGCAILENLVPAHLEYTPQTMEAIRQLAYELAGEGFSWLVAPPHLPENSPAIPMLRELGFQVEMEMLCYERTVKGKLLPVPTIDPAYEIRSSVHADIEPVMELLRRTAQKHAPDAVSESSTRYMLRGMMRDASLAAYRDGKLCALTAVIPEDAYLGKDATATLWWAVYDPELGTRMLLEHMIASGLPSIRKAGYQAVRKDQLRPECDAELILILEGLGFKQKGRQYNLKLDLRSLPGRETPVPAGGKHEGPSKRLKPLTYTVSEGTLSPKYEGALEIEVREVLGTSPTIGPGEVYVVSGRYTLSEPIVPVIDLACDGMSWGYEFVPTLGTHDFTATANVIRVTPGREHMLVLHTPNLEPDTLVHKVIALGRQIVNNEG